MKKLDELSFTETKAMFDYAGMLAAQYAANALYTPNSDAAKWRMYVDELEISLETKIRAALDK